MKCVICDTDGMTLRYRLRYGLIFECPACRHAVAELGNGMTPEKANAVKFGGSRVFDDSSIPIYRTWARERLAVLSRELPPGCRLIEFGPGGGEFLWEATRAGYRIETLDRFDSILEANRPESVRVNVGDAESFQGRGEYDGVVAFHLLEHMADPRRALSAMRSGLRRDGVLLIEVPNYASTARWLQGARWGCFEPCHIQYFTPESLSRLCAQAGFRVKSVASCGAGGFEEAAGEITARGIHVLLGRHRERGKGVVETRQPGGPCAGTPASRWRAAARRLYWGVVSAARFPFRPISAIERRLLRGGNLRVLAEREG